MKIAQLICMIVLSLMVLTGCSTYQLSGKSTGDTVVDVTSNTFTITFCGNAYMTQDQVGKYALQRAAEITLSKGYANFLVMGRKDDSETCGLGADMNREQSSRMTPPSNPAGSSMSGFVRPNIALTIRCFHKGEKMPDNAIDAKQYLDENFPGLTKNAQPS